MVDTVLQYHPHSWRPVSRWKGNGRSTYSFRRGTSRLHKRPLSPQNRYQTHSMPKHSTLLALVVNVYALLDSTAIQLIILCCTRFTRFSGCASEMAELSPTEIQYELEHIGQDRAPNIIVTYATCLSLACIAVVLRFVARRTSRAPFQADDLTIFIALVRNTITLV